MEDRLSGFAISRVPKNVVKIDMSESPPRPTGWTYELNSASDPRAREGSRGSRILSGGDIKVTTILNVT